MFKANQNYLRPTFPLFTTLAACGVSLGAFDLSLIFRRLLGAGTPREWNNLGRALFLFLLRLFTRRKDRTRPCRSPNHALRAISSAKQALRARARTCRKFATYTTRC